MLPHLPAPSCRQRAALVFKRFAAAACSPELLRDVIVSLHEVTLSTLHSFTAWLGRHGEHMQRLTARLLCDDVEDPDWPAALASCLAAAGTAGQLEQLTVAGSISSTEWLAAMRSLRICSITNTGEQALRVSAAISGLTALQWLELGADSVHLLPQIRLPFSISRLELSSGGEYMPPQASWDGERTPRCSTCRQCLNGNRTTPFSSACRATD